MRLASHEIGTGRAAPPDGGGAHVVPAVTWRSGPRLVGSAVALSLLLAACTASTPPASAATAVSAQPSPGAATATASTSSVAATPAPSPAATLTLSPTTGTCAAADLVARVTLWEGAAGHRAAHVELTNTGPPCAIAAMAQPQLVEGHGAVLIDGIVPSVSPLLTMGAGGLLKTVIQDGNYCGPLPAPPVTVAFVLAGATGRVVALPVSTTDTAGVPPCFGTPGSAGDIEMQPWAP